MNLLAGCGLIRGWFRSAIDREYPRPGRNSERFGFRPVDLTDPSLGPEVPAKQVVGLCSYGLTRADSTTSAQKLAILERIKLCFNSPGLPV